MLNNYYNIVLDNDYVDMNSKQALKQDRQL